MAESKELEAFLNSDAAKKKAKRCMCCKDEKLANAIICFMEKKANGEANQSLYWMHENFFSVRMNGPKTYGALVKHVKRCLKLDPDTGRELVNGGE